MRNLRSAAIAALALVAACRDATPAQPTDRAKPDLYLLTPLPIVWNETFGLEQPGSPALTALEGGHRVTPVDLPRQVPEGALLLAAQPRAMPAEELVKLDAWVRRGGRLLLLADPMLEWPSARPLGDRGRPPIAFPDTGLLQHWGLRLDAPDQRGPMQARIDGMPVLTVSPGMIVRISGSCKVMDAGLVARCNLGRGKALIVADADLLNVGSDSRDDRNLAALLSQVASLTR